MILYEKYSAIEYHFRINCTATATDYTHTQTHTRHMVQVAKGRTLDMTISALFIHHYIVCDAMCHDILVSYSTMLVASRYIDFNRIRLAKSKFSVVSHCRWHRHQTSQHSLRIQIARSYDDN